MSEQDNDGKRPAGDGLGGLLDDPSAGPAGEPGLSDLFDDASAGGDGLGGGFGEASSAGAAGPGDAPDAPAEAGGDGGGGLFGEAEDGLGGLFDEAPAEAGLDGLLGGPPVRSAEGLGGLSQDAPAAGEAGLGGLFNEPAPSPPSVEPEASPAPLPAAPPAGPAPLSAPAASIAPGPSDGARLGGRVIASIPTVQGPGLFQAGMFSDLPDAPLDPLPGAEFGQPLISPEESEAIIRAMRAGSIAPASLAPPPSAAPGSPESKPLVLGAPDALLRRSIERADRVAIDLADALVGALLEQVAMVADTEPMESAVDVSSAVFEPYVDTGTAWDAVVGGEGRPWATVVLGGSFADVVLARRLGADGMVARPGARTRSMNSLGRRVLAPIAEACVKAVAAGMTQGLGAWTLVPAGSTEIRTPLSAPCLRIAVRVRMGEVEDDALVAVYEEALVTRSVDEVRTESARRMQTALQDIDVELAALLGATRIAVRDLLALQVGSVIRLSGTPDAPVLVSAAGTAVLSGMPIVHQGNLAIEVIT